ncbi:MAG: hypothetical protein DBY38_02425 [Clostridium cadaveris]|uniref:Uncharacterized protein n=1 Tax=Clostridium cadaveris TaxID=1529 RepID=A0A316MA14_9CLOT|nr:MAG: hypothetical protein DBY38_02425 [Clostridium cadaveris]
MKEIVVDPFTIDEEINIGYQYDHKATKIVFSGLEDNNYYLKLQDTQSYQAFPIPNNEFEITNTYTQKTLITGQIYRKIDNELIAHGKIFKMSLKTSIPQSNKIKEIVPPAFKNEYDRMVDTTNEINKKLISGEFNGENGKDGKDYEHSEEFEKLSKDIEKNALNSANNASSALTNANKAKEYLDSVVNKTNTFNSDYTNKVNSFNEDYNSKVDAFNSNVEDANAALDAKIEKANTDLDKKMADANTSLDTKISEANNTIDTKVTEATEQASKAKQEADRAVLAMDAKLDKNQGAENAGKTMVVDADGNIVPGSALPDNVYTQEEVNALLQDKMDILYSGITITQDININYTLDGDLKINSIMGNTIQEENPTPENPSEIMGVTELNVKTVGKNLFNREYASNLDNWTRVPSGYAVLPIRVPQGVYLTTSGPSMPISAGYYSLFSWHPVEGTKYSYSWLYHNTQGTTYKTFTRQTDNFIYLYVSAPKISAFLEDFKNLQIELGDTATEYQPYMESSVVYNLEKPLFSIGNIADTINLETLTRVNNIYKEDLTALTINSTDNAGNYNHVNTTNRFYNLNKFSITKSSASDRNIYSSILPYIAYVWSRDETGITINAHNQAHVCLPNALLGINENDSSEERKIKLDSYIKSLKGSGNEYIYYALEEPAVEQLEFGLVEMLKQLKTFNPCTNIIVDGDVKPIVNAQYPKDILAVVEALEKKVLNLQEATIKNV